MSIEHRENTFGSPIDVTHGEVQRRLTRLDARRFRGFRWVAADDAMAVGRYADDRIALLLSEIERQRRENRGLADQVEMLRHGALPSTATRRPDAVAIDLAMRAQDEANRTVGDASREGAEIIAEARRQAAEILAEAHRRAADAGRDDLPGTGESRRRLPELEKRHATLVAAVTGAQQTLQRCQEQLAEQLRHDAVAAEEPDHLPPAVPTE